MKKIISTTNAPAAVGPYSQAVMYGDMLYTSGQIGLDPATGAFAGDDVVTQAKQVCENLKAVLAAAAFVLFTIVVAAAAFMFFVLVMTAAALAAFFSRFFFDDLQLDAAVLAEAGMTFDNVIKTTCFLAEISDFAAFNAIYADYFVSLPARSCVAAKALPKGVLVEVETIAYID